MKVFKSITLIVLLCVLCGVVKLRMGAEVKIDAMTAAAPVIKAESIIVPKVSPSKEPEIEEVEFTPKPTITVKPTEPPKESMPAESGTEELQTCHDYYDAIPLCTELQAVLFEACERNYIDPAIALALIQTESDFDPYAVNSCSGCYGLCQLNPACFPSGLSPAENINYGMDYLGRQIRVYGNEAAGLTAYNVGHDNGTRGYANVVLSAAVYWREILEVKV